MNDTKAKILEALDALSEEWQREVLDFVEFLRSRTLVPDEKPSKDGTEELNPEMIPSLMRLGA